MPLPHFTNIRSAEYVDDFPCFMPYTFIYDRFESDFANIQWINYTNLSLSVVFKDNDKFEDILLNVKPQEIKIREYDKEGKILRFLILSSNVDYKKTIDKEPVLITFDKLEIKKQ